jgi:hypothetical protein
LNRVRADRGIFEPVLAERVEDVRDREVQDAYAESDALAVVHRPFLPKKLGKPSEPHSADDLPSANPTIATCMPLHCHAFGHSSPVLASNPR